MRERIEKGMGEMRALEKEKKALKKKKDKI